MKFSIATVAAFAAGTQALAYSPSSNNATVIPDTYTTKVVTALTTVCPTPTQVTYGGKTYTVTSSTTLTITDCPCTVSYKASTPPVVPATSVPVVMSSASAVKPASSSPMAKPSTWVAPYYPSSNGTAPASYTVTPTGGNGASSTPSTTAPPQFTGAATKVGAGAMALVAAAAAFL